LVRCGNRLFVFRDDSRVFLFWYHIDRGMGRDRHVAMAVDKPAIVMAGFGYDFTTPVGFLLSIQAAEAFFGLWTTHIRPTPSQH